MYEWEEDGGPLVQTVFINEESSMTKTKLDYSIHPGILVEEASEKLGMSVDDVSKKTGVDYSEVEKFFNGETFPEKSALKKICGLLGLSVTLVEICYNDWKSRNKK